MLVKETAELATRLKIQFDRLRKMEYQHLGLLSAISLDDELGQRISVEELKVVGRVVDLMHKRVPIALSLDHMDLLLPNGLPPKLPDIPDPGFPGCEAKPVKLVDHIFVPTERTPHVAQKWSDRASGETMVGGVHYMVLQPVRKLIVLRDVRSRPSDAAWPRIVCRADQAGRHMLLLFNPETGRAHLVFGRFEFSTVLAKPDVWQGVAATQ